MLRWILVGEWSRQRKNYHHWICGNRIYESWCGCRLQNSANNFNKYIESLQVINGVKPDVNFCVSNIHLTIKLLNSIKFELFVDVNND